MVPSSWRHINPSQNNNINKKTHAHLALPDMIAGHVADISVYDANTKRSCKHAKNPIHF
jgi:hypothetical protein